jgi:hypothetical protein
VIVHFKCLCVANGKPANLLLLSKLKIHLVQTSVSRAYNHITCSVEATIAGMHGTNRYTTLNNLPCNWQNVHSGVSICLVHDTHCSFNTTDFVL